MLTHWKIAVMNILQEEKQCLKCSMTFLPDFPRGLLMTRVKLFFLHLVVALANQQHQNVSSMILRAIQKLLGRIGDQGKSYIF